MTTPPVRGHAHATPAALTAHRPHGYFKAVAPSARFEAPRHSTQAQPAVANATTHLAAPHPRDEPAPPEQRHARERNDLRDEDPLDPMTRWSAQSAPPPTATPSIVPPAPSPSIDPSSPIAVARTSLEDLLPSLVRKVAWSGDGRRGTVRMELGAGALAGATLLIHADDGRVRVELDAPSHVNAAEWRTRIHDRLTRRGLLVDSIDVR